MEQNNKNRRSFLKSTGTALVAGTVLPFGFNIREGFAGQRAKLKVGLIGCGGRGTGAAAQALKADKDAELTAMGDIFSDYLEESYQSLKKINPEQVKVDEAHKFIGFDAIQQVLDSGVDVVILTTPPAFRPSHFKAAVEAGKHVFVKNQWQLMRRVSEAFWSRQGWPKKRACLWFQVSPSGMISLKSYF